DHSRNCAGHELDETGAGVHWPRPNGPDRGKRVRTSITHRSQQSCGRGCLMLFDPTVSDATFVDGRPPKDIKNTIETIREEMGLNGDCPWSLISARTKLGRVLFEIEEEASFGCRRLIGKLGDPERAVNLHRTLISLRDADFKPPARLTVPEPVACLPERGF